jgi:hypothetical protein
MLSANLGCKLNQIKAAITVPRHASGGGPRYTVHGRVLDAPCANSKETGREPRYRDPESPLLRDHLAYRRPLSTHLGRFKTWVLHSFVSPINFSFVIYEECEAEGEGASPRSIASSSATSWHVYFYCLSPPLSPLSYRSHGLLQQPFPFLEAI